MSILDWRFVRRNTKLAGLTLAAMMSLLVSAHAIEAQDIAAKSKSPKQIATQLSSAKIAKVIVILNVDKMLSAKWERSLATNTNRAAVQAEIKLSVDRVAGDLGILKSQAYKPFSTVAAFAAQLDSQQIQKLLADNRVKSIENDMEMKKHLDVTIPYIQSPQAFPRGATGLNTSVVVIDDGIQRDHPFIGVHRIAREACILGFNGCPNGTDTQIGTGAAAADPSASHGTHVAGIVLGYRAAGSPRRGVAFVARLIPINIFGNQSSVSFSTIQRAFEHVDALSASPDQATLRIAAINMSVGGDLSVEACDDDAAMTLLRPVIQRLRLRGIPSVISSGNDYETNRMSFPACLSDMVSVASTSRTGVPSSFSNISISTDLFAPGGEFGACVQSSVQPSAYEGYCGTSMAAPHVAGAIAALKTGRPTQSTSSLVNALRRAGPLVLDNRSGGLYTKPRLAMNDALTHMLNPTAPINDNIENATVVTLVNRAARVDGHNVGATRQTNEQRHSTTILVHSTSWWRFTAAVTGTMTISTLGSDFDTAIAVLQGTTHGNARIAGNDNANPNVRYSSVDVPVVAGQTYSIAVGGTAHDEQGQVYLRFTQRVPPANDAFANARTVTVTSTDATGIAGNNTDATREPLEPFHNGYDGNSSTVWFRFTPTVGGTYTIDTFGSRFDTVLAVYTGTALSALTPIASNDDGAGSGQALVTFTAVAGQRYEVALSGFGGAMGSYRVFFTPPGVPVNKARRLDTASVD